VTALGKPLRIGTRGSTLALWQARDVARRLEAIGEPSEIVIIRTSGDRASEAAPTGALPTDASGKRLFVKEIEDALLRHEIDLAVHSSKDMPAELPTGLAITAVLPREDPADALVLPASQPIDGENRPAQERLRPRARIGTGSIRRVAQLRGIFPDATFENVRGNLDTRLRKLDGGGYDALVLAAAGLRRLGFASRISWRVPVDACVPAPGQGIIAIETRRDDDAVRHEVARINDGPAEAALAAERAVVLALGGGCQMPIGAVALPATPGTLELHAIVTSLDGARAIRYKKAGPSTDAPGLGRAVAEHLLKAGAEELLKEARRTESDVPNH